MTAAKPVAAVAFGWCLSGQHTACEARQEQHPIKHRCPCCVSGHSRRRRHAIRITRGRTEDA